MKNAVIAAVLLSASTLVFAEDAQTNTMNNGSNPQQMAPATTDATKDKPMQADQDAAKKEAGSAASTEAPASH